MFLYIFYGIINKRIEFAVPSAQDKSKKPNWDFNFPNPAHAESIFQPQQKATKDINDAPATLNFEESQVCDICSLEKQEHELFVHPDGFKICNDCIARKKHYETNHN
jgi:recombinational DNA repair protein RecR